MTQKELEKRRERKRERNRKIAAFVADGNSIREASISFDVSPMTASNACAKLGVQLPGKRASNLTLFIIADLLNTLLNQKEIAAKHDVHFSAVSKVAARAAQAGIIFSPRTRNAP